MRLSPHKQHTARRDGFSLIEIVFAATILTIAALTLGATLATNLNADNSNRDREQARIAAQSQMENVLAWQDYNTVRATFDGINFEVDGLSAPATQASAGQVLVNDANPDLLLIRVQVAWVGGNGTQTVELSTLLSRPIETIFAN